MIAKFLRIPQTIPILFTLALLISNLSFSQNTSDKFELIFDSDILVAEKEKQFDNLLLEHTNNNDTDLLLADRFEILKWHYKQGNIEKTLRLVKRNLILLDSLKVNDTALYRKNNYALGYYLRKNNQFEEASKIFNVLISSDIVDLPTFKSYSSLAQMSYNEEDYYAAAEIYENGLELATKENNLTYITTFTQGAGFAYKVIKTDRSLERGITITKEALELLQKKNNLTIRDKYVSYNLYDLLGNLYNDRDDFDFDQSILNYSKAEKIAIELNDSLRLSSVYNNIGYLYLHNNQKEANDFFDKGLAYNPDKTMLSLLHRNKAEYYLKNNDKSSALIHIQKSIHALTSLDTESLESLPKTDSLQQQDYKYLLLSSIIDKAKIWIDLSEQTPFDTNESYQNALKTLYLADDLVDVTRLITSETKSKLYWRKTASDIYVNAVKVCYELNLPKEAFYFIEKNKSLLLLEDLNKKQLIRDSNIPKSITDLEAQLNTEIIKHSLSGENNESLFKAKETYRRFIESLSNEYHLFFKVQQPADVITIDALQSDLKPNAAYLEFILDDDNGYGLLITKNHIEFYTIDNCIALKQNVMQFRNLISRPLLNTSDQNEYNLVSNSIYESLFPKQIKDLIKNKSLTIIPDYYLQNIPFEALQTDKDKHSYLILNNEINYAYSASLLDSNKKIVRENDNNLVGFAPINFEELPTLKNTKTELELIDDLFNSDLFIETEASKSNFINTLSDYNILHIASHANAGTADVSPWIQFYDDRLNLQELYELDHSAELVVLSACETSLGENYKGEGVMSLTRGFFNSGANSVISTLWSINDKSSTEIMTFFYSNLNNGYNRSSALREAKLKYIETSELSEKSPYYWASFVLIGDTGQIDIDNSYSVIYYIIFTFILLLIAVAFFKLRKKS